MKRCIEAARAQARADNTTLNEQFRQWLSEYVQRRWHVDAATAAMAVIADLQSSRTPAAANLRGTK